MDRRAGLMKLPADALVTSGAGGERHVQLGTSCGAANDQVMPARMGSAALLIHLLFAGNAADTHRAAIHQAAVGNAQMCCTHAAAVSGYFLKPEWRCMCTAAQRLRACWMS